MPLSCESIYNEVEKEAIAIANVCYELWAIDLHAILHNIAHSTTQQFPCIDRPCRRVIVQFAYAEAEKTTNRIRIECVWFDIHSQRIAIHLLIGRYWISRMLNNIQPICGDVCVSEWDETCIDRWRFLRTWKVIDKLLLLLLMMWRCWYWYIYTRWCSDASRYLYSHATHFLHHFLQFQIRLSSHRLLFKP